MRIRRDTILVFGVVLISVGLVIKFSPSITGSFASVDRQSNGGFSGSLVLLGASAVGIATVGEIEDIGKKKVRKGDYTDSEIVVVGETHQWARGNYYLQDDRNVQKLGKKTLQEEIDLIRYTKPDKVFIELDEISSQELSEANTRERYKDLKSRGILKPLKYMKKKDLIHSGSIEKLRNAAYEAGAEFIGIEHPHALTQYTRTRHAIDKITEEDKRHIDEGDLREIRKSYNKALSYMEEYERQGEKEGLVARLVTLLKSPLLKRDIYYKHNILVNDLEERGADFVEPEHYIMEENQISPKTVSQYKEKLREVMEKVPSMITEESLEISEDLKIAKELYNEEIGITNRNREEYFGKAVLGNLRPGEKAVVIVGSYHAKEDSGLIEYLQKSGVNYTVKIVGEGYDKAIKDGIKPHIED